MKFSIKAVRVALFIVSVLYSAPSNAEEFPPRLPSDAEIEELYAATNRADVLYQRMGDLLKSMSVSSGAYHADELRHVQSVLLTNIVTCPLEQHELVLSSYSKENLLREVCRFDPVHNDLNALMCIVDYLGTLQLAPTNSMPRECMAAWNADATYREQLGANFLERRLGRVVLRG